METGIVTLIQISRSYSAVMAKPRPGGEQLMEGSKFVFAPLVAVYRLGAEVANSVAEQGAGLRPRLLVIADQPS